MWREATRKVVAAISADRKVRTKGRGTKLRSTPNPNVTPLAPKHTRIEVRISCLHALPGDVLAVSRVSIPLQVYPDAAAPPLSPLRAVVLQVLRPGE